MASYSPVFSSQFILYTDDSPISEFEVPAGFTAVIRDFSCYAVAGATYLHLLVSNSEVAPEVTVAQLENFGISPYQQWTGRVVVPAGGFISLYSGDLVEGLQVYAGGYLLRNTLT